MQTASSLKSPLLLVDNGSIAAASTLNLRRVCSALSERVGETVLPVSIAYSDRVPAKALGGEPALNLETAVFDLYAKGVRTIRILPFIFAGKGGIARLMERKLERLQKQLKGLRFHIGPYLYDERRSDNTGVARILADRVRAVIAEQSLKHAAVVLLDHGSPHVEAANVRDAICAQLGVLLAEQVRSCQVASMERRDGVQYAFNEPLLERRLRMEGFNQGDVVIAMLFLSPGKHAGEGGDVAQICAWAQRDSTGLRTHRTELVGTHPDVVQLLLEGLHL